LLLLDLDSLAERLDAQARISKRKILNPQSDLVDLEHECIHQWLSSYEKHGPETMQGWLTSHVGCIPCTKSIKKNKKESRKAGQGQPTVRKWVEQRAGRLIRSQGKLTLSMSANAAVESELLQIMKAIDQTA